jgi:hypothetical protein
MKIKLPEKFGTEKMKDGSTQPKEAWHRRLPNWEPYDEIVLKVVPRYKTSGMSGDMWRTSTVITFKFKGVVIDSTAVRDMDCAIMLLGYEHISRTEPIGDEVIDLERGLCDQPSCCKPATNKYLLKRICSKCGDLLDPNDRTMQYFRQFCDRHAKRGDCSREDCDANYEVLEGTGPDGSTNTEESPASIVVIEREEIDNET